MEGRRVNLVEQDPKPVILLSPGDWLRAGRQWLRVEYVDRPADDETPAAQRRYGRGLSGGRVVRRWSWERFCDGAGAWVAVLLLVACGLGVGR